MAKGSSLPKSPVHIRANLIIPSQCQERFLGTPDGGVNAFRDADLDYAGISQLVRGYDVTRLACWHHVLIFTLSGSGWLDTNGSTRKLDDGSLCILPAGGDHRYYATKPWNILWLHPKPTPFWNALIGSTAEVRPFLFGRILNSLAEVLWTELASDDVDPKEAARLGAELMLHYARRELKQREHMLARTWRLKLEAIWQRAFAEPNVWTVTVVANTLHCSRSHLNEIARQLYGQPIGERLLQIRIQRAADLLRHTPWPIRDIAERVGYADAFSFSKAFHRHTGMAPSDYRKSAG